MLMHTHMIGELSRMTEQIHGIVMSNCFSYHSLSHPALNIAWIQGLCDLESFMSKLKLHVQNFITYTVIQVRHCLEMPVISGANL